MRRGNREHAVRDAAAVLFRMPRHVYTAAIGQLLLMLPILMFHAFMNASFRGPLLRLHAVLVLPLLCIPISCRFCHNINILLRHAILHIICPFSGWFFSYTGLPICTTEYKINARFAILSSLIWQMCPNISNFRYVVI